MDQGKDKIRAAFDRGAKRARDAVTAGARGLSSLEPLLPELPRFRADYEAQREAILRFGGGGTPAAVATEPRPAALMKVARLLSHLRHGLAESSLQGVTLLAGRVAATGEARATELLLRAVAGVPECVRQIEQFFDEQVDGVRVGQLFAASRDEMSEQVRSLVAAAERVAARGEDASRDAADLKQAARELVRGFERLRRELDRRRVDLREIVRDAAALEQPRFQDAGSDCSFVDEAAGDARVFADSTAVRECVAELLRNAARYTARGGRCVVTLAAEGGRGEFVLLTVENSPVDRATGGERESTGEGHAMVRRIVEEHAGELSVSAESEAFVVQVRWRRRHPA